MYTYLVHISYLNWLSHPLCHEEPDGLEPSVLLGIYTIGQLKLVAPAGFAPTPSGLEPDLLLLQLQGIEIVTFNYTNIQQKRLGLSNQVFLFVSQVDVVRFNHWYLCLTSSTRLVFYRHYRTSWNLVDFFHVFL